MPKARGAALASPRRVISGRWVMTLGESGWPSATPRTGTGRRVSAARSALEITTAAPPSLSRQQSKRRNGSEIIRDA